MDLLVWTLTHPQGEGRTARLCEDGTVDGDAELAGMLRRHLSEPVTVFRHGTVATRPGAASEPIELQPGDRRYVVACVRALCAGTQGWEIVDCDWRDG